MSMHNEYLRNNAKGFLKAIELRLDHGCGYSSPNLCRDAANVLELEMLYQNGFSFANAEEADQRPDFMTLIQMTPDLPEIFIRNADTLQHWFTDDIPKTDPELLAEVIAELKELLKKEGKEEMRT